MRILSPLVVVLLLLAGCATLATFDNGCQGSYGDLCRVYVAREARCHSSPEVPDADRQLCAAQARQAYRDDVEQREQQRVRDTFENIMRGQRSVCGRATGGTVPCGQQVGSPSATPGSILPTAPDGCEYVMVDGRIHTVCR
jgi:hypothetical protein